MLARLTFSFIHTFSQPNPYTLQWRVGRPTETELFEDPLILVVYDSTPEGHPSRCRMSEVAHWDRRGDFLSDIQKWSIWK